MNGSALWAIVIALSLTAVPLAADVPPVFSEKTLPEAKQAAAADQIVLVYATADWCPPCRRMKQKTWVDDGVVRWIDENAIAVLVDVDEQPDLADELGVRGIPAMIAFRDGEEFDRVTGYHDPDQFIDWLQGVQAGERARDRKLADPDALDMRERIALARELLEAGEYEPATEQYLYVWENMRDEAPRLAGLRPTIAMQIGELIEAHEPARGQFEVVRDHTQAKLKENGTRADVGDWISLNIHALGDDQRVIAWAETVRDEEEGMELLRGFGWQLRPVFEEHERLDLVGLLETNPELQVTTLWRQVEMVQSPEGVGVWAMMDDRYDVAQMEPEDFEDPELQAEVQTLVLEHFMTETSRLYTSLAAAGRHDEADAVADLALDKHDTAAMRLALVRTAAHYEQARPRHLDWLENAREAEPDLADEIDELRARVQDVLDADSREGAVGPGR